MKRYIFTVGNSFYNGDKYKTLSEISSSVVEKLNSLGIWNFTEMSITKTSFNSYEYTFYGDFPETAIEYTTNQLLTVFELAIWGEMSLEQYLNWHEYIPAF